MAKLKLVYICSLRNAAADLAGQHVRYKDHSRYMKSPLQYLAEALNDTALGDLYSLEGVIYDDDQDSPGDQDKIRGYGFTPHAGQPWFYPRELQVQGRAVSSLVHCVPSSYRRLPLDSAQRPTGKRDFEQRLRNRLVELEADVVVLDGLLVILDELVRPGSDFRGRIVNIHPGVTRLDSPYERRGAYATLDALYGARGQKVTDWNTLQTVPVAPLMLTGASFHYVDNGIDSGEVIHDVLQTPIAADDTILELRWNNFNNSLFPALHQGLEILAKSRLATFV